MAIPYIDFKQNFDNPNNPLLCPNVDCKKSELVPVRFVMATAFGHLDDFPWDWYVHSEEQYRPNRKRCADITGHRHLRMNFEGKDASISSISIECTRCKAKKNLSGIFNQEQTFINPEDPFFTSETVLNKPWLGKSKLTGQPTIFAYEKPYFFLGKEREQLLKKNRYRDTDFLEKYKKYFPVTLQRGAGNIFFPVTHRGISLPDFQADTKGEFERLEQEINGLIKYATDHPAFTPRDRENDIEEPDQKIKELQFILTFFNSIQDFSDDVLLQITFKITKYLNMLKSNGVSVTADPGLESRSEEYKTIISHSSNTNKEKYYEAEHTDIKDFCFGNNNLISKVVILHKLKQINIQIGFTRVRPLAIDELKYSTGSRNNATLEEEFRRIQRLDGSEMMPILINEKWLPAVESKGEGIFIELNNTTLETWYTNNKDFIDKRINILNENYWNSLLQFGAVNQATPRESYTINHRYLLLHTLSHLLMEAMSANSGYNVSSLGEIIYCDNDKLADKMNGILIYTAGSDAEGTLGGLAEMGRPGNLEELFKIAIDKAQWCSADPICIETSKGQGFMGLNMAACHACCMLPETSCENMNRFLDRGLLVGDLNNPDAGLFKLFV
jgi:hypothetical protein